MPGRFPYKKLAKYPHMKPEDVAVWERFIDNNPQFFDTCDYDVAVGEGAPQSPELPENIQADGKILTQKKIDVVAYQNNMIYLIEVKPICNMRAIGQILAYYDLYTKDHPGQSSPLKMIVCSSIERELEATLSKYDIIVEVA